VGVTESLPVERFSASESGGWSNSYLLSDGEEALLFDVFQLRTDAEKLTESVSASGKQLTKVWISHAHPDHFLQLDLILDHFPEVQVLTTHNVLDDLRADGPWMFNLLQGKLGSEGPVRFVEPTPLEGDRLLVGALELEIVEFGPGEAKHHACLVVPDRDAIVTSDLIYNGAHLYLQERNLTGWLERLGELEKLAAERRLRTIHPGHGPAGGLSLIQGTREYLHAFAGAIETGNVESAREAILSRFPDHHVLQFLDLFSLPAYLPQVRARRKIILLFWRRLEPPGGPSHSPAPAT
jgi:glyoxylase-like metal-dependent hydrolase (beta-lactamase superfamily II)